MKRSFIVATLVAAAYASPFSRTKASSRTPSYQSPDSLNYLLESLNLKAYASSSTQAPQAPLDVNKGSSLFDCSHELPETDDEWALLEFAPSQTCWATEEGKWALKRQGINFMDITDSAVFGASQAAQAKYIAKDAYSYPTKPAHNETVHSLLPKLKEKNLKALLTTFSGFWTRYYKSEYGRDSAEWLLGQVNDTLAKSGALEHGAFVTSFPHSWEQPSVIARIPGKTNTTVIASAHQDSINLFLPSVFAAPGADDDGSGTVTILEALRVLLKSRDIVAGKAENTIEFHWYSAEEGGLLGSQDVYKHYAQNSIEVAALFHQDMTGYVKKTEDAGEEQVIGILNDFVDRNLTDFLGVMVDTYCEIPYKLTECGYACSDHASATKYGYPSCGATESEFKMMSPNIHTTRDTVDTLSFEHMIQHSRLAVGAMYELAFAKF